MSEERRLDVNGILKSLVAHSVEFILIGGTAAQRLELPVPATIDVDVVPLRDNANLEKLANFFENVNAMLLTADINGTWFPRWPVDNWSQYDTLHLLTEFGLLDLVFLPAGTSNGFSDLLEEASLLDFDGVQVLTICESQWVQLKSSSGRQKDLNHLSKYFSEKSKRRPR